MLMMENLIWMEANAVDGTIVTLQQKAFLGRWMIVRGKWGEKEKEGLTAKERGGRVQDTDYELTMYET